jgi:hypothetical protein
MMERRQDARRSCVNLYPLCSSVIGDRFRVERLTKTSKNPRMKRTVKVVLSRRSFSASSAGATMKEKPAIAVSLPIIFTKIL